ncbi:MAG: lysophospholipid acyltransferase family protein [Syntrophomonadaceae bacterium]|jgi:1-acyl-sn-glycerol-3-phosphate acyltransferase|nr:1-acyl-sn-glycerol-3-phosphate acyltransferase [Syntrophomonadaceae bacterium]MDH7497927.1 lysophospholipid acyltransferase family protein [Syntrophomonadaceae bacterium]
MLLWLFRWRVEGEEHIPRTGPVILAANHLSNWDPILVGAACSRPVHFMAKEEMFRSRWLAWLLTRIHAFPVRRGSADRRALRTALDRLAQGEVLGIFPEGTRSKTGELARPQPGIAMLALRSGAPVVPVACIGSDRVLPLGWKRPLLVRVGEPICYEELYGTRLSAPLMETVSQDIMEHVRRLIS